jgi:hypothetical protein
MSDYKEVGSMLGHMICHPEKFKPKANLPPAIANRQHIDD